MIQKRFEELRYCGTLPSSAGVGLAILRMTQREDTPASEIANVLRCDPALAGKVLRLANIARPAGAPVAGNLERAVLSLGASTLRSTALSFSLLPAGRAGVCGHFDHDTYWSHAIACAEAAEAVAREQGDVDPGDAFTCALLARIGMLALATVHAEVYERILSEARGRAPEQLLVEELRQFDIQHWEVTAAMFVEWGLPDTFVHAVLSLGLPKREPGLEDPASTPLAQVLRSASFVAHRLLEGVGTQGALGDGWLSLLSPVGGGWIGRDRLVALCARVAPTWRSTCESLRLPTATLGEAGLESDDLEISEAETHSGTPTQTQIRDEEADAPANLFPDGLHVLAVDDEPSALRLLERHLVAGGYRVTTARDAETALRVVAEDAPHLLLTDWLMPGMTGGDLLRAMRATEVGRQVYGIVLTARDDEAQVVAAFDAGADDFVAKPYNPRVLMARVAAGRRMLELQHRIRLDRERRATQVAELGIMSRKLHAAAHLDVLTGLPNRRYAMRRLEQEWADAVRLDRPLAVLVVDIDHFKQVNDRHGHDVGDDVLRSTAAMLRARTRRADVVCRLGGEEFLVINVDSDRVGAGMCAERLRSSIEANVVKSHAFEGRVTISIGLATRGDGVSSVHELLKAADDAVYAAKAAGRNTIRTNRRWIPESA
ncbi:MAG: diguanylate cyclase [Planctomycetota bacterium]|nr:diguanylate cyclase [Planctomycetota bacterium]